MFLSRLFIYNLAIISNQKSIVQLKYLSNKGPKYLIRDIVKSRDVMFQYKLKLGLLRSLSLGSIYLVIIVLLGVTSMLLLVSREG